LLAERLELGGRFREAEEAQPDSTDRVSEMLVDSSRSSLSPTAVSASASSLQL
jgi:hypothetical protein